MNNNYYTIVNNKGEYVFEVKFESFLEAMHAIREITAACPFGTAPKLSIEFIEFVRYYSVPGLRNRHEAV